MRLVNESAERAYLGSVLVNQQRFFERPARAEHFWTPMNRRIGAAVVRLAERGVAIDVVAVETEVERDGGGKLSAAYLFELTEEAASAPEAWLLLDEMRIRRELDAGGRMLVAAAREGAPDPGSRFFALAEDIAARIQSDTDAVARMDILGPPQVERILAMQRGAPLGVETGFLDVDRVVGGLAPGEVTIVAGRPGMGKSVFLQQVAERVGSRGGRALVFTVEMSKEQYVNRSLSRATGLPLFAIRRNDLDEPQQRLLAQASYTLPPVLLDDSAPLASADLLATASRLAMQEPLALVAVDYLQLVGAAEPGDKEHEKLSRAMKLLKAGARRLNCPFVVGSQIGREGEKGEDKRGRLRNLKGSGAIEEDADVVLILHRPAYYDPDDDPTVAEVWVDKNRNGPTGPVRLYWDGATTSFRNREEEG